jgi:hypothetical protein
VLGHAGDSVDGGRAAADLAAVIRAHLEHLCVAAFCAVAPALLVVIVLGGLVGGGPGNGPLYFVLLLTAGAFLAAVPYALCRWWRYATTCKIDRFVPDRSPEPLVTTIVPTMSRNSSLRRFGETLISGRVVIHRPLDMADAAECYLEVVP